MPITSETGPRSGSPVRGLRPEDEDGMGWEVGSMGAGSGPELDFAFKSFRSRGRFRFTLVDGPGVSGSGPDVTGRDFVFLRFEFLGGGLTVVEAITDSPTYGRRSDVEVRNPVRRW